MINREIRFPLFGLNWKFTRHFCPEYFLLHRDAGVGNASFFFPAVNGITHSTQKFCIWVPRSPPSQFPKAAALNCYTFHTGQQGDTHVWQVQDENYLWASLSFLQLIALEMKFHWPTASGQTFHTGGWEPTFFSANLLRRWKTISKYGAKWTVGASQHKTNSWGRVNSHRIFSSQSADENQGLDLTALKVDNKTKWFTTKIRHQTSGNSQPKRRAVSFLAKGC